MTRDNICKGCKQHREESAFPAFGGYRGYTCKDCLNTRAREKRAIRKTQPVSRKEVTCLHCDRTLPVSNFYRCAHNSDGISHICKTCAGTKVRNSKIKTKYGVQPNYVAALWWLQEGRCAICDDLFKDGCMRGKGLPTPYIDHEHSTGKVRGLLCMRCNIAIGILKDSAPLLHQAQNYLRAHI